MVSPAHCFRKQTQSKNNGGISNAFSPYLPKLLPIPLQYLKSCIINQFSYSAKLKFSLHFSFQLTQYEYMTWIYSVLSQKISVELTWAFAPSQFNIPPVRCCHFFFVWFCCCCLLLKKFLFYGCVCVWAVFELMCTLIPCSPIVITISFDLTSIKRGNKP